MNLVFATNNIHKAEEIQQIVGTTHKILHLKDINCYDEIPEDYETLEENARQKAMHIFSKYHIPCFADDTGLEVFSINNKPGVYSARYASRHYNNPMIEGNAQENMKLLLEQMKDCTNRDARFRTVIFLKTESLEVQFEGIVEGSIAFHPSGTMGFGYDPLFIPKGFTCSFAEMNLEQKNTISHRARAVKKLVDFLLHQ